MIKCKNRIVAILVYFFFFRRSTTFLLLIKERAIFFCFFSVDLGFEIERTSDFTVNKANGNQRVFLHVTGKWKRFGFMRNIILLSENISPNGFLFFFQSN